MKFWQAVVVAQMAGGAVWADRYRDALLAHIAADTANVLVGLLLWVGFKAAFETSSKVPTKGDE